MATSRSPTHPAHRQPWIQAQYEERDSGCEIGGRKHRIPRPEHRRRHRSRGDELDGCVILMFDAQPGWAPTPAHLRVYVKTRKSRSILRLLCGAREVTRVTRSGFRAPRRGQPGQAEHGSSSSRNASNAFRRLDPGTVAMPGTGSSYERSLSGVASGSPSSITLRPAERAEACTSVVLASVTARGRWRGWRVKRRVRQRDPSRRCRRGRRRRGCRRASRRRVR